MVNENNYINTTPAKHSYHNESFVEENETCYCGKRKITFISLSLSHFSGGYYFVGVNMYVTYIQQLPLFQSRNKDKSKIEQS